MAFGPIAVLLSDGAGHEGAMFYSTIGFTELRGADKDFGRDYRRAARQTDLNVHLQKCAAGEPRTQ